MKYDKEITLIQTKCQYQDHIDTIISSSTNRFGIIDTEEAKSAITRLWFCNFIHYHANLDTGTINQIWSLFDDALCKLDHGLFYQHTDNTTHEKAQAEPAYS